MNPIRDEAQRRAYERARSLTRQLISREGLPLAEVASAIVAEAERQMSGHLAVFPLGKLACRAGCTYCCHVPHVRIAAPELARIAESLARLKTAEVRTLRRRLDQAAATVEARVPSRIPPCPLLVDGRCLVYEVRPLVCRTEHSFDVGECERQFKTGHGTTTQCALVLDAAEGTLVGVAHGLRSSGLRPELLNLARALPVVLDCPDALNDWLRGGRALDGALAEG